MLPENIKLWTDYASVASIVAEADQNHKQEDNLSFVADMLAASVSIFREIYELFLARTSTLNFNQTTIYFVCLFVSCPREGGTII